MESTHKKLIRSWRLVPADHDYDPYNGMGAARRGGRWNKEGVSMLYTSASISLAMLEIVANLRGTRENYDYLAYWVDIPKISSMDIKIETSPYPNESITKLIGTEWTKQKISVALQIPSAVNPFEMNYLINPEHSDFSRLKKATKKQAQRIEIDPRIIKDSTI